MTGGIRWLTLRMVLAFHRETLQRHGGSPGGAPRQGIIIGEWTEAETIKGDPESDYWVK